MGSCNGNLKESIDGRNVDSGGTVHGALEESKDYTWNWVRVIMWHFHEESGFILLCSENLSQAELKDNGLICFMIERYVGKLKVSKRQASHSYNL